MDDEDLSRGLVACAWWLKICSRTKLLAATLATSLAIGTLIRLMDVPFLKLAPEAAVEATNTVVNVLIHCPNAHTVAASTNVGDARSIRFVCCVVVCLLVVSFR
jgi:hypothetical protein